MDNDSKAKAKQKNRASKKAYWTLPTDVLQSFSKLQCLSRHTSGGAAFFFVCCTYGRASAGMWCEIFSCFGSDFLRTGGKGTHHFLAGAGCWLIGCISVAVYATVTVTSAPDQVVLCCSRSCHSRLACVCHNLFKRLSSCLPWVEEGFEEAPFTAVLFAGGFCGWGARKPRLVDRCSVPVADPTIISGFRVFSTATTTTAGCDIAVSAIVRHGWGGWWLANCGELLAAERQ